MKTNDFLPAAFAAMTFLCAACDDSKNSPATTFVPAFIATACPANAAQAQVSLSCGTVEVPENRAKPDSRRLKLFVVIARTQAADKAADPVMLLSGGPTPVLDSLFVGLSRPGSEALLGRRDFIAFDYRGMGYSTPNLSCEIDSDGSIDQQRCANELSKNQVDPAGYTDNAMAADAEDIRKALKLGAMNLWGTSYGSRIALILERQFPAGVRSMILDGSFPTLTRKDAALAEEQAQVVHSLLDDCAADPACGAAFPDLAQRFSAAVPLLNYAPLMIEGKPTYGDDLVVAMQGATSITGINAYVPLAMDMAARGTLTTLPWQAQAAAQDAATENGSVPVAQLTYCGANVFADDEAGLITLSKAADEIVAGIARSALIQRHACAYWPATPASKQDKQAVSSAKPILIFNGQYDANTPLAEALKAQSSLSNAQLVTFPGFGHVAFGETCPAILALQFFDALNQVPIDQSCLQTLGAPAWVVSP